MDILQLRRVLIVLGAAVLTCAPVASAQSTTAANGDGVMRDDRLANRIEVKFAERRSFSRADVDVTANDRTVTLTGKVDSEQQKQRAERLAERTPGVEEVNNQLTVDADLSNSEMEDVPDDQLSQKVAERLADSLPFAVADEDWIFGWEVNGANWDFDIDADDGDLTLDGEVGSYNQFLDAVRAARDVPGVKSVDVSDLEVDNEYGLYDPFDYGYWRRGWYGF